MPKTPENYSELMTKFGRCSESGDTLTVSGVYFNDDGTVNPKSYSKKYREDHGIVLQGEASTDKSGSNNSGKNKSSSSDDKSWWEKALIWLVLAPFRLLWWIIKQLLNIITVGYFKGWFDK